MEEIKAKFAVIEDPRHEGYIEHKLSDILLLVMGAVISGMTELADMMTISIVNQNSIKRNSTLIKSHPNPHSVVY